MLTFLDRGRQLNDAMFPLNGASTGYVLKPAFQTKNNSSKGKWLLRVTVVSAYHLHKPEELKEDQKFNPLVSIEVYGNSEDVDQLKTSKRSRFLSKSTEDGHPKSSKSSVFKTDPAQDNGFNPVWNSVWTCIVDDENYPYTFIRFGINTEESGLFGSCTCRVQYLNEGKFDFNADIYERANNLFLGYRHVSLNDLQGKEFIFSKLLLKISKTRLS